MYWILSAALYATPLIEVPAVPPWPSDLSAPVEKPDGAVELPADVANHLLFRMRYLDETPALCRVLIRAQHEQTAAFAQAKCNDQIAAAMLQARDAVQSQPPHDMTTRVALVAGGFAGGVVAGVVAAMIFLSH